jgi:hypothetical protein
MPPPLFYVFPRLIFLRLLAEYDVLHLGEKKFGTALFI